MILLNPGKKRKRARACRKGYGRKRGGGCRKIGTGRASHYGTSRRSSIRGVLGSLVCGDGWEKRVAAARRGCVYRDGRMVMSNPGVFSSVTAGFAPSNLMDFAVVGVGAVLNQALTGFVVNKFGLSSRIAETAAGIGTAGLTLLVPGWGSKLFAGGMTRVGIATVGPMASGLIQKVLPAPAVVATPTPAAAPAPAAPKLNELPYEYGEQMDGLNDWSDQPASIE